jgi:hypothetical protein
VYAFANANSLQRRLRTDGWRNLPVLEVFRDFLVGGGESAETTVWVSFSRRNTELS